MDYLDERSFFGGQLDVLINQMYEETVTCEKFCRSWSKSNKEQVEFLSGEKVALINCENVGPNKYDLNFSVGKKKLVNWFGTACCPFAACAKAYQSYYDESY